MKTKFFVVLLLLLFTRSAFSEQTKQAATDEADFQSHVYANDTGETLPYRLLEPAGYDAAKGPYPLLIFLHGAGERGTNNHSQLVHGKPLMREAAAKYGCFVLAPQCPPKTTWAGRHWTDPKHKLTAKPSQPMRLLAGLIEQLEKKYPIDPDRLYIMGLSMGGFGTWEMVQRYPNRFAAAAPICGGGDETLAEPLVGVPIWAFHGDCDGVVSVARSRDMVKAIKSAGGKSRYTEYPGVGHGAWTPAFKEPELLEWMCGQKRNARKTP